MKFCFGQSCNRKSVKLRSQVTSKGKTNHEVNKSVSRDVNPVHSNLPRENARMNSTTSQDKNVSTIKPRTPAVGRKEDLQTSLVNSVVQGPAEYQKLASLVAPQRNTLSSRTNEDMKIHRGPLNLNSVTMRDPKAVYEELILILESLDVKINRSAGFAVKCEYRDLRFAIEINSVEKFMNIYVVKFYKSNQIQENYFELCNKVFAKLNL